MRILFEASLTKVHRYFFASSVPTFVSLSSWQKPDNSQDVKVGTLIALLVDTGDSWQNVEVPEAQEKPATAAQIPTPAPKQIPTPTPAPVAAAVQPHSTSLAEGSADDWYVMTTLLAFCIPWFSVFMLIELKS